MRKGFKNINEQTNRMKSLFTDERLYGNLVDKPKVITEQRWLRALSEIGVLKKYPKEMLEKIAQAANRPIRTVDDFIKVFDDFPSVYAKVLSDLAPAWKVQDVKDWLNIFKQLNDANHLGVGAKQLDIYKVDPKYKMAFIDNFPEAGGVRDMVEYLYWKKTGITPISGSKGIDDVAVLPAKKGNELVIRKVDANGNKIDGDVKIDKNPANSGKGANAPKEKEIIDIDYEEIIDNPDKIKSQVNENGETIIKVSGVKSEDQIKVIQKTMDKIIPIGQKEGLNLKLDFDPTTGNIKSVEVVIPPKSVTDVNGQLKNKTGDIIVDKAVDPEAYKGIKGFLNKYMNPLKLTPAESKKIFDAGYMGSQFSGSGLIRKGSAFGLWNFRLLTVLITPSLLCGLIRKLGSDSEKSMIENWCGNPVLTYLGLWKGFFGITSILWGELPGFLCSTINGLESINLAPENDKGEPITCDKILAAADEIVKELKNPDAATLEKWGVNCDMLVMNKDGVVDEAKTKEKISKTLSDSYMKIIQEKLNISEPGFLLKKAMEYGNDDDVKKALDLTQNTAQMDKILVELKNACLQHERNKDKIKIEDDQTIIVIHDNEEKTTPNDDDTNSGNTEDQPDL